jgi:hypothetical protein
MSTTSAITEADILEEIIVPSAADLPAESARSLLRLKFSGAATRKIRKLLRQNNRGDITAEERLLLEKYLRVGRMLDLIQAKARLSLKKNGERS